MPGTPMKRATIVVMHNYIRQAIGFQSRRPSFSKNIAIERVDTADAFVRPAK